MNRQINREGYPAFARNINPEEKRLIAGHEKWLPDTIIDCHAHCNLEKHVLNIEERAFQHMLSTFLSFSLEESNEWNLLLHPGKKIFTLRFPGVARGIDHREANSYLLRNSPEQDRIALFGLSDDIGYTIDAMQHPQVSALKMYHSYSNPSATQSNQRY
jgi:hypothetical protein